jgi:hypothetical protein
VPPGALPSCIRQGTTDWLPSTAFFLYPNFRHSVPADCVSLRNRRVVVVRSSKGLCRTPLAALLAALGIVVVAGCALVDTVDKRADWMNESVARFRVQSILRNILRSARDEPLSFAALSQIEGHNTSTNSFPTFPSINWAGFSTGSTGSGSSSYNVSSDFTLNPVEDSASTAALLNPLDASTIALFSQLSSGYPTNFLYLLLLDKFRVADSEGRVLSSYYRVIVGDENVKTCIGNPEAGFCGTRTMLAYTLLAYSNLRFNFEKGSVHGQSGRPRAQICFLRGNSVPGKWSDLGLKPTGDRIAVPARPKAGAHPSYCDQEGTWLPASRTEDDDSSSRPGREKPQGRDKKSAGASYLVYDDRNKLWIELTPSSVWGIYQFLGTLADGQLQRDRPQVRLIQPGYIYNPDELILLNVVKGGRDDCFAQTVMDDRSTYCVPNGPSSRLTRIYFTILQQLTAMQRSVVSSEPRPSRNVRGIQ